MKQLQFQLWKECNSKCEFCYLGKDNLFSSQHLKLQSIKNTLQIISKLELYKKEKYDTISLMGGEFFQGQLNTIEIKFQFLKLIDKILYLLNNQFITDFWLYVTLTIGNQQDLYEVLEKLKNHKGNVWILTSYDTRGRFHSQKMEDTWKYHMHNIYKLYPNTKFNITTILSKDCIEKYLDNKISFKNMMEQYHTEFFFKQCGLATYKEKSDMLKTLPWFLPERKLFLEFLKKFRFEEYEYVWLKLFNVYFRADTFYRDFNDLTNSTILNIRNKNSKKEITSNFEKDLIVNKCGHMLTYAAYADCDNCVLCDKNMIQELYK